MATVPHVTSGLGLRKFQVDGFLLTRVYRKSKHILCPIVLFFFENRAVWKIMCKNIIEPDWPQMKTWSMSLACWIVYKYTHRICNNYFFSTATMVARKHLYVTLYVQCLPCSNCLLDSRLGCLLNSFGR